MHPLSLPCSVGEQGNIGDQNPTDFSGAMAFLDNPPSRLDIVLSALDIPELSHRLEEPAWRVVYTTRAESKSPWPIAQVFLVHRSNPSFNPAWDDTGQTLPGEGTLRDQLLTLPLFSIETGYFLHYEICIVSEVDIPLGGHVPCDWDHSGRTLLKSWDLGLEGYRAQRYMNSTLSGGRSQRMWQLLKIEPSGKVIVLGESQAAYDAYDPYEDYYFGHWPRPRLGTTLESRGITRRTFKWRSTKRVMFSPMGNLH